MSTKPKTVISEDGETVLIDSNALLAYLRDLAAQMGKQAEEMAKDGLYKNAYLEEEFALFVTESLIDGIMEDFGQNDLDLENSGFSVSV